MLEATWNGLESINNQTRIMYTYYAETKVIISILFYFIISIYN